MPPEPLPYSAEEVLVRTENSLIASTPRFMPSVLPGLLLAMSLITKPVHHEHILRWGGFLKPTETHRFPWAKSAAGVRALG